MAKKQTHEVDPKRIEKHFINLCNQLGKSQEPEFIKNFLESLLTESEIIMISRRIEIADLLMKGKSQEEICREMRIGALTVASVAKTLRRFLQKEAKKNKKFKKYESKHAYGTFDHLRKTYRGYFAIINAFLD